MDEKLKVRVCSIAGTQTSILTQDAVAFLNRRTKKWLKTRTIQEGDLLKAAEDMKRRYPLSFPLKSTSTQTPPPLIAPQKAVEAKPTQPPRAKTTEPTIPTPSPSPVTITAPLRPYVVRRLQAIAEDSDFQVEMQKEATRLAELRQKDNEKHREKLHGVHQDMQRAEAERLLLLEQKRKERAENRELVIKAAMQVKLDEQEDFERRRARFQEEKRFIEEQRESRRLAKERDNVARQSENVMQREVLKRSIEEHERQEREKSIAVRDSLLHFLDESKSLMDQRRRLVEQQKRQERERDKELLKGEAFEAYMKRDAKVRTSQLEKVATRNRMQEKVGDSYAQLVQQQREKRTAEEAKLLASVDKKLEQESIREAEDYQKKLALKNALVHSLDEEIARKEERKRKISEENAVSRLEADRESAKYREELMKEKNSRREKQQKLRMELDSYEAAKMERLLNSVSRSGIVSPIVPK